MADTKPIPNYDARQVCIADMRARFREVVADPLRTALQKHGGLHAAAALLQIPIEAASAGFTITICQHTDGWQLDMSRQIDADITFQAAGRARSLKAALVQLVDGGLVYLDQLDSETRQHINKLTKDEQVLDIEDEVAA